MTKRVLRRAAFAAVAVVLAAGTPAYAQASSEGTRAAAPSPDLKISVAVPSGEKLVDESFRATVTIENTGDADATAVTAFVQPVRGTGVSAGSYDWKEFAPSGPGGTIAAGQSVTLDVGLQVLDFKDGDAVASFWAQIAGKPEFGDNIKEVIIPITPPTRTSVVGGRLYADANDNGGFDTGEGLAGITLNLQSSGLPGAPNFEATTSADGRFDIHGVPARIYSISYPYDLPGGWVSEGSQRLRVDGTTANAELRLRAVKPLRESLNVTAKFLEGPYKPGDRANVAITLTNTGSKRLERLVAGCDRAGSERHLGGWADPAQWGDLAIDAGRGTGVTLQPGETKTVRVSGTVPAAAPDQGVVHISCDFGPIDQLYITGYPTLLALAKVPGKSATSEGWFYEDRNGNWTVDAGEAIAGLEVSLTDPLDGSEVAKATTRADGSIKFGTLPAGWYVPVFHGQWKMRDGGFVVVTTEPWWGPWETALVSGQAATASPAPVVSRKAAN